jgi:hypothetical protein
VGNLGDLGEIPRPVLTRSHPVLTSITPVSKLLTHIIHTHPEIKSDVILDLGRIENWSRFIMGLSTAERTGSPVLHTLWTYVL